MVAHSAAGSSYASSTRSSSVSSALKRARANQDNQDGHGEHLVGRRSTIENGIFGVLFTLSKENSETRIRIRWVLVKILLDAWQLFTTVINPATQGWRINANGTAWKVISVLNFTWLGDLGYGAYLAVLYCMLALLAVNVVMCVWVAWCFKEHKFPVVWPIKVLRVFSSVFFQAFDVASLNLLQLGISCHYSGPVEPHLRFSLFPSYSCTSPPHVMHAVVSALCLVLFVAIGLLLNMSEVEVNPLSRRPLALGHSGAEVMAFAIKVLLTLVDVFIGWRRVAACLYLALSVALAWQCIRWSPNLVAWVNYMKAGVSVTIVWCSVMLVALVFRPAVEAGRSDKWASGLTVLMLAGLMPAFGVGAAMSWTMIRRMTETALKALAEAEAEVKLEDICENLDSPRDVEVVARCCRVWKARYTLDAEAVNKAHQVIKAGVAMFPKSAYMVLLHANFMIEVLGVSQSGSRRIQDARKLNPGIMCRFIMFVRQQQASQRAAGSTTNDGAHMDLLGYVEYQRKQRMVVRLHREALQAMCGFWKALDSSSVSFTHLSKALGKIESSVSQAHTAYRVVLESYGNNPSLVRLYGRFLLTIKNDPWSASEYLTEADRLEEIKNGDASGPLLPDGTPLGRMDELSIAVLVTNATGEVQMANRQTHVCFGYKRGTLEGKPLSALLAPHCNRWLTTELAKLVTESGSAAATTDSEGSHNHYESVVVGMHCERLAFPVRLSLNKASGVGEDSTIIALMEPIPPVKGMSSLWVTANGTVAACDPQFASMFGWGAAEVNGASILTFLTLQETHEGTDAGAQRGQSGSGIMKRLKSLAKGAAGREQTTPCAMVHKYDNVPVACTVRLSTKEAEDTPVHEVRIRLVDPDPPQLLVVTNKGAVVHASPELAGCLKDALGAVGKQRLGARGEGAGGRAPVGGVLASTDALAGYTFFDFLPPPWREMHTKFLRDTTLASAPTRLQWSCRKGSPPGPTLELRSATGKPLYMHVSVATTDLAGELTHVVRLARSSLEAALAEHRLRLSLTQDGRIAGVADGSPKHLFGLEQSQVVGRTLWDLVEGCMPASVEQPQSLSRSLSQQGLLALGGLVSRALDNPDESWRVVVVPPPRASGFGAASIAQTAQRALAKPAVMQVHVQPFAEGPHDKAPFVFVDLWPISSLTGVLELDGSGRISAVLEEGIRPAGLLFGLPSAVLVGAMFADLVTLSHGRTSAGELLSLHGDKKSSLKANKKAVHTKVGPVHILMATHSDGRPLALEVQVVGKPGPNQPLTAILRPHVAPMLPSRTVPPSAVARLAAPRVGRTVVGIAPPALHTASVAAAAKDGAALPPGPAPRVSGPGGFEIALSMPPPPASGKPSGLSDAEGPAAALTIDTEQGDALPATVSACNVSTPPGKASPRPTISPDSVTLQARMSGVLETVGSGRPSTAPIPMPSITASKAALLAGRASLADLVKEKDGSRSLSETERLRAGGGSRTSGMVEPGRGEKKRSARQPTLPGAAPATLKGYVAEPEGGADHGDDDPLLGGLGAAESDADSQGSGVKRIKSKSSAISAGRVLEWVASKGAYYQNSVCPSVKSDDDKSKTSDDAEGPVVVQRPPSAPHGSGPKPDVAEGKGRITSPRPQGGEAEAAEEEAGSEAGHSGVSGLSAGGGAEYKRGKRFRKLAKMMDSSQAQQVQRRFRAHALIIVGVLTLVHVVCFALVIMAIDEQRNAMMQLGRSGQAQRFMHQILTDVRSLDIISQNRTLPHLYTADDAQAFVQRIATGAEEVKTRFNEIHDAHHEPSSPINQLFYFTQHQVWNGKHLNGSDKYINVTVWDFATRFFAMAKDIEQQYDDWQQSNTIVSETAPAQFLLKSGPDLFRVSRQILDALLFVAVDNTRWVDTLQLVFLAVEGAFVSCLAACYLAYLLRAVAAQRYKLYSLFLVIPVGLTRALASQNTALFIEDEDEEEEEEERTPQPDPEEEGAAAGDDNGQKIKRRATLKLQDDTNPAAVGRAAVASAEDVHGVIEGAMEGRYGKNGGDDKYDKARAFPGDSLHTISSRGCWTWLRLRIRRWLLRLGQQQGRALTRSPSSGIGPKRALRANSKETVIMLMPFVVWSALVIAIYATAVVQMRGVVSVVAVHSVVNFMSARTSRSVFYAQELAATEDPALLSAGRAALAACMKLVKDAWYTLQLGQDAYLSAGPNTERFPLVEAGLAYASPELSELFYRNGHCHRIQEHLPCPGPDYRFYHIIHTGLDSIMQQFIISLDSMASSESPGPEGLENDHFDFIYSVGAVDLLDGTVQIADAHYETLRHTFNSILVLHIVLFLLLILIFLGFLLLLLNPLLKRVSKERRHIAELMSQLPLELDVEKLVERALGTGQGSASAAIQAATGSGGKGTPDQQQATNEAPAFMGANDGENAANATTKWKAIIRAASSLTGKTPQGGLNRRRSSMMSGPVVLH